MILLPYAFHPATAATVRRTIMDAASEQGAPVDWAMWARLWLDHGARSRSMALLAQEAADDDARRHACRLAADAAAGTMTDDIHPDPTSPMYQRECQITDMLRDAGLQTLHDVLRSMDDLTSVAVVFDDETARAAGWTDDRLHDVVHEILARRLDDGSLPMIILRGRLVHAILDRLLDGDLPLVHDLLCENVVVAANVTEAVMLTASADALYSAALAAEETEKDAAASSATPQG